MGRAFIIFGNIDELRGRDRVHDVLHKTAMLSTNTAKCQMGAPLVPKGNGISRLYTTKQETKSTDAYVLLQPIMPVWYLYLTYIVHCGWLFIIYLSFISSLECEYSFKTDRVECLS